MSDLISRQAAIDILTRFEPSFRGSVLEQALKNMPSAQPDLDEWCPDCKEYDSKRHCCPRFNRVIRETLKDGRTKGVWLSKYLPICIGAKEIVEVYICSNCGHVVDSNDLSNFCSVCGCDMRGEQDV